MASSPLLVTTTLWLGSPASKATSRMLTAMGPRDIETVKREVDAVCVAAVCCEPGDNPPVPKADCILPTRYAKLRS